MFKVEPLPSIEPMPPSRTGRLPWVGAGLSLLRNPTETFRRARAKLGDTFVLDAFGYRLFCVFSPQGVRRLYELAEHEASFGLATFELVMKRKVPLELLVGRRTMPHDLFGKQDVEDYLEQLDAAVTLQIEELGDSGTFDVFSTMRRLGHRLGLGAWAGHEAASRTYLDRLVPLFDALDSGDSFVRPASTLVTWATKKRREIQAMRGIEAVIGEILRARTASGSQPDDYLRRIYDKFADLPPGEREMQTARDVIVLHMGAQSNLYAALAWTLCHLLLHPEILRRVRDGDDALLERAASESIRMAQRSLTLRMVMSPLEYTTESGTYKLEPRVMIATMLPVNNTSCAAGLERYDPDHYEGRKLAAGACPATREMVSTFGHGRHSCPAQRFSISAIRISIRRLLDRYELEPLFTSVEPRRRQIGGVARAQRPCRVRYRRR